MKGPSQTFPYEMSSSRRNMPEMEIPGNVKDSPNNPSRTPPPYANSADSSPKPAASTALNGSQVALPRTSIEPIPPIVGAILIPGKSPSATVPESAGAGNP